MTNDIDASAVLDGDIESFCSTDLGVWGGKRRKKIIKEKKKKENNTRKWLK